MGLHDRPYWKESQGGPGDMGGSGIARGLTVGLPKPAKAVKTLLIINFAVFLLQMFFDQSRGPGDPGLMSRWLGVTVGEWWQVWRYLTCQFLHGGFLHILLNMLGLYLLGTPLEQRALGTKRFVIIYLLAGAVGGLAYVIIGALFNLDPTIPIIGASGGVYAIVLACAVYFPHFRLIFLFFPVPIRLAALIIFGMMIFVVLSSLAGGNVRDAMSDVAHLGGASVAAFYIWGLPRFSGTTRKMKQKVDQGSWERRMRRREEEEAEVDRILDKIKQQGINSLSRGEKKTLQEATRHQREEEKEIYR
ncbi:MAG: rhomboid family intramembrane serine protease [Phycisphaerae bacterium]